MDKKTIIEAGVAVWRDQGIDKLTLRSIAKLLQITHPAILYHFGTMANLKNAIAQHALQIGETKIIRYLVVTEHSSVASLTQAQKQAFLTD